MSNSVDKNELREELEAMTIAKVRSYAAMYNISYTRDMSKDDIITTILDKMAKKNVMKAANLDAPPAPGRTRVLISKDVSIGTKAGSRPVPVWVNGYVCTIPRGVAVDVPHKVVEVLKNSYHWQMTEDTSLPINDPKRMRFEPVVSYPFQILASTPGPDPSPGNEKAKQASYGPRLEFFEKFGRWPKRQELLDAMKQGFIKMRPGVRAPVADEPVDD